MVCPHFLESGGSGHVCVRAAYSNPNHAHFRANIDAKRRQGNGSRLTARLTGRRQVVVWIWHYRFNVALQQCTVLRCHSVIGDEKWQRENDD